MANMKDKNNCLSYVKYGGLKIPAIVKGKKYLWMSIHPEKVRTRNRDYKSFLSI